MTTSKILWREISHKCVRWFVRYYITNWININTSYVKFFNLTLLRFQTASCKYKREKKYLWHSLYPFTDAWISWQTRAGCGLLRLLSLQSAAAEILKTWGALKCWWKKNGTSGLSGEFVCNFKVGNDAFRNRQMSSSPHVYNTFKYEYMVYCFVFSLVGHVMHICDHLETNFSP